MNTEKLIESIIVGDASPKDFYRWSCELISSGSTSENIDIVLGIASESNPSREELFRYFKYVLDDIGIKFPAVSRGEYILSRFKPEFEKLIFSITEDELRFIAHADRAQDIEKHYLALKHLIFEKQGIYSQELYWYPYEVVELTRWGLEKGHEREFAISNCIIAQSIIAGTDGSNDTDFMLAQLMPSYVELPDQLSKLVIEHVLFANRCQGSFTIYF